MRIVVMGVSGCGKTTVGRALAAELGLPYVEGDELHPPQNVQRMAAGVPLTDADREGWLQQIAARLAAAGDGMVVSCSALKRSYRDLLRRAAPDLRLVHLHGPRELLAARLATRQGHYMPASLLQSQLDTLELPGADEGAIAVDVSGSPAQIVADVRRQLETTPA
jgi:carbohydrate kinase (thermoresistant glucokinase family)